MAKHFGLDCAHEAEYLFDVQKCLMYDDSTRDFTKNQPDLAMFHARTYEIVRFLDLNEQG